MHIPVLLNEILEIFDPKPGETYIDATVNGGGHAKAILQRVGRGGKVIGIEWDSELVQKLRNEIKEQRHTNFEVIEGNYRDIKKILSQNLFGTIDGILFDFGYSSYHVDSSKRGFSFREDEPLDMRYNIHDTNTTAKNIVNTWPENTIADILRTYGEERWAKHIARAIAERRKKKEISTTFELVDIVNSVLRRRSSGKGIHPATRTFQALRIATNEELVNIEKGLIDAIQIVKKGGVIGAISFHSLEDRLVKQLFRRYEKEGAIRVITKKSITPGMSEIQQNRRARSAKLRIARKNQ
jgi:16S rRNA (cytosine1402-N4)-methyltransferase